jgi:hypothetical protein
VYSRGCPGERTYCLTLLGILRDPDCRDPRGLTPLMRAALTVT